MDDIDRLMPQVMQWNRAAELVRRFFPGIDDQAVNYILWNETGWPSFIMPPYEDNLIVQLRRCKRRYRYADKRKAAGKTYRPRW